MNPNCFFKIKTRAFRFIALTLFAFSLFIPGARTVAQGTDQLPDIANELPPARDSILSIRNLSTLNDTIKSKQVIAIKYQGSVSADSLKTLYIDGLAVEHAKPWRVNAEENIIYFTIDQAVQSMLLQFAKGEDEPSPFIPVYFGLGNQTRQLIAARTSVYVEVHQNIPVGWFIAAGLLIAGLIFLSLRFQVLKDDNNLYYSLSRTQLFFWTLLFMISYLYICFQTNSPPDIPSSVLIIIGISVTTTGASRAIDSNAKNQVPIDYSAHSEGFIVDILSDGSSINIQRFQNVIFNLLFGILFLQKTLSSHLLPDFDQNVLILLGVSSGAYAGLKATEKAKDQTELPGPTLKDEMIAPTAGLPPRGQSDNLGATV